MNGAIVLLGNLMINDSCILESITIDSCTLGKNLESMKRGTVAETNQAQYYY